MKNFIKFDFVSYEESKKFCKNQENRNYKPTHVKNMQKQFLTSFEIMPAITVNVVTNNVIDGQHRLKAFQTLVETSQIEPDLMLKVMFVKIPLEEEIKAIIDANTNSKGWSLEDYITSYVKAGNVSYVKLDEWCKRHSLSNDKGKSKFRYGAAIITGKRCKDVLQYGVFSFTDAELRRADEVHAEMLEIVELFNLKGKGAWIESLAVTWNVAREQHDFRTWIKELKSNKEKYLKLPKDNSKEWKAIFADAHYEIDNKTKK